MHKRKILLGFVVLAAFLALQVGAAYAAPLNATVPDGTIVSVTQTTDASNNVVFDVVVTDSSNVQQTVQLTPAEAVAAGLVTDSGGGTYTVNNVVGQPITGGVVTAPGTLTDGTITSVTQTTDASNNVTFTVVITDSNNVQHTVVMTAAEAVAAGLVTANSDGTYTVNNVVGQKITGGLLVDPCKVADGTNPVATALTDFFCKGTVLGGDTISQLHDDGYGYGLIAQACFMAEQLNTTCSDLLMDKTNKNFTDLGVQGVSNWGQLRKYVGQHIIQNLGSIMSGRATPLTTTTTGTAPTTTHGHGNGGNGNGHGNGNGNGHGNKP